MCGYESSNNLTAFLDRTDTAISDCSILMDRAQSQFTKLQSRLKEVLIKANLFAQYLNIILSFTLHCPLRPVRTVKAQLYGDAPRRDRPACRDI